MYPNEPLIVPAVRSYLSYAEREKNKTASTVDMKDAEAQNIVVRRRNRPRYTIIYKDSSSEEEEQEKSSEASPQRPRLFRRSLLVFNPSEIGLTQIATDQIDNPMSESTDLSGVFTPSRVVELVPRQETVRELADSQEIDPAQEPFEAWDSVPPCSPAVPHDLQAL